MSGFTLNELFDCCDDEKYAKFLRFVRNSEAYSYSISNIGTILDRVPRYSKFEQIFSAGFDDIIKDGLRFKYSINEIPKSLIKLCRKYPIKLSNNTVKYYKENQDAHYIAYNLDYLSLDFDDIYIAWNTDIWDRVDGVCIYYSFFNKLVNEYGYNAKDLWLYLDRIKTFEAASQNNCVSSYIDKVIDGKCHILFLRKRNKPDESLVTIEVRNNHIVQTRRRFNDDVTAEDQKAIDAFNKKFANKEDKAA